MRFTVKKAPEGPSPTLLVAGVALAGLIAWGAVVALHKQPAPRHAPSAPAAQSAPEPSQEPDSRPFDTAPRSGTVSDM